MATLLYSLDKMNSTSSDDVDQLRYITAKIQHCLKDHGKLQLPLYFFNTEMKLEDLQRMYDMQPKMVIVIPLFHFSAIPNNNVMLSINKVRQTCNYVKLNIFPIFIYRVAPPPKKKKIKKKWNSILPTMCGCNSWYQCMRYLKKLNFSWEKWYQDHQFWFCSFVY